MRDIELLREQYREVAANVVGAPTSLVRVFLKRDTNPQVIAALMQQTVDTSNQVPLINKATGRFWCRAGIPGIEPADAGVT